MKLEWDRIENSVVFGGFFLSRISIFLDPWIGIFEDLIEILSVFDDSGDFLEVAFGSPVLHFSESGVFFHILFLDFVNLSFRLAFENFVFEGFAFLNGTDVERVVEQGEIFFTNVHFYLLWISLYLFTEIRTGYLNFIPFDQIIYFSLFSS